MDFAEIWDHMGLLARLVTIILAVMAIASAAVFIERLVVFYKAQKKSRAFAQASATPLEARDYAELVAVCKAHEGSHLAELVRNGIDSFMRAKSSRERGEVSHVAPVELARRSLGRALETQAARLRRGFPILASVGSVAPFVGLFGTVIGILTTFNMIGQSQSGGLGSVMMGISEALVVTGIGLAVAIPAVLAFNMLVSQSEKIELGLTTAASELTDHLENAHGSDGGPPHGVRPSLDKPLAGPTTPAQGHIG